MDAFDLKVLARALVVPPTGPLLLVAVGLLLAWRRRRAGLALATAGLLAAWTLSIWPVAQLLAAPLESELRRFDVAEWRAAAAAGSAPTAIVVLGGGAVVDGPFEPRRERLASRTVMRMLEGARIARETGLPMLVSGGTAPWLRTSEAALMRRSMLEDFGVDVRWAEDASRDTDENARLSARLLREAGVDSIVLVTHAPHMKRARAAFERAGMTVWPAPHEWATGPPGEGRFTDWLPSASAVEAIWLLVHEHLGLLWYRLRGHA